MATRPASRKKATQHRAADNAPQQTYLLEDVGLEEADPGITNGAPALKIRPGRGGRVRLTGEALVAAAAPARRREFMDRCFGVPTLQSMRISADGAVVDLLFEKNNAQLSETLAALAAAMKTLEPGEWELANYPEVVSGCTGHSLDVYRTGQRLTFWRIEAQSPSLFRCAHPLLRLDRVREGVLEELATLAGLEDQSASRWQLDSLTVRVQAHRVTTEHLLDVLEPAIAKAVSLASVTPGEISARSAIINTNLVLAPVTDYLMPVVGVANLFLGGLLNFRNIKHAYNALRKGRFTLSALHSTMYGMGFIAYEFLGDALKAWTSEHWPRRVARLRQESQRKFLARYRRYPRRVWVERTGVQVEVGLADLHSGETVVLRHGDIVPGDGVVTGGRGLVMESWITGEEGAVVKKSKDAVYASSQILEGEIHMQIVAIGGKTVAANLANWFEQVFQQPHPRTRAVDLGEKMALPAFVLSIASIQRGGIHMAKAVGHPDFRSGPGIAAELSDLAATLQAGFLGVCISSPETLTKIAEAECFVIDESAGEWRWDETPGQETVGHRLRELGVKEVVLLSHRPADQLAELAEKIGADSFQGRKSRVDKAAYLEQRRMVETKAIYFGEMEHEITSAADVAVVVTNPDETRVPQAAVVLRQADLEKIVLLRMMALESLEIQKTGIKTTMGFNIACVAGAIFMSLPILGVVALTNLGTMVTYRRLAGTLRSVEKEG